MLRMYNVGLYLRKTYNETLGDSIRKIEVRSTDRDRCLESAQLVAGGAYVPTGRWIWNPEELWIPIPVHTMPMPLDKLLYPFPKCPAADEELSNIFNSGGGKTINETNKEFYKFLSEKTGVNVVGVNQASDIFDILMNEKNNKVEELKLPEWVNEMVYRNLSDLHTAKFRLLAKTRKIQRFRVGLLLNEILKHSENAIKSEFYDDKGEDVKKAYFYSTHDIFLTILMTALHIDNGINPPFGSTIIFELHKHKELFKHELDWDDYSSIKIYYLNETETEKPYLLTIPTCLEGKNCTMKQFRTIISDLVLDEKTYDKECGLNEISNPLKDNKDNNESGSKISSILIIIILIAVSINLLLTLIYACKKRN